MFLATLNDLVPGLAAVLPSEAQWEYACRAGTTTPFSFGETITPEQVNYNGNYPYRGGTKGLYRQETVPVGSLPANPWGLYEMHGNVWEWCAEAWHHSYEGAPFDGSAWVEADVSRPACCAAALVRRREWRALRVPLRGPSDNRFRRLSLSRVPEA